MIFSRNKKGQSAVEYTVLLILLMGAFIGIQNYMKRGVQGRWKASVDELGDQYDPRTADTDLRETQSSQTNTSIISLNTLGGYWTKRTDASISQEQKSGYTSTGSY
jgi:Flp pilus assembly pilin Flp